MHTIWSGSISFGLVNIPVKLFSAIESDDVKFSSLSKTDHSQIRYKRVSETTGEEVAFKDIVKGFEYEKGKYVIIEDADFEKISPLKSKTIEIMQFSKVEEIDPLLYDKPYYLHPAKGGEKTYKLLQQSLGKSGLVGIAQFMMRNREHICVVRSYNNRLLLNQLRYQDELRALPEEVDKSITLNEKELQLAKQLIDQLTDKFDASKFKDHYVEELKKIIAFKTSGKKLRVAEPKKAGQANVKDLMEVLKASLGNTKKGKAA
ncbi:MAG: hypothetical protein JWP69_219 [Flaviaesturariibacter sp.]|nr:hypothetical protein [Flaviaesturariibacter sp.]